MNLEDHVGDVIRKARAMNNAPAAGAARAAGLTEAELAQLEDTGHSPKLPDFMALGKMIGLDAGKLRQIAEGWLPSGKDLTKWRELRVLTTSDGSMSVNAYLVWDEVTLLGAMFDAGFDAQSALEVIAAEGVTLGHIFITHSHHDHLGGLGALRQAFPKVKVHSGSKRVPVDQRVKPSEIVHLGGLRVTYRETPGHAEDGITYIVGNWQDDAPHAAMVGDAIFAGSIGRGNQSWDLARQKAREQILSLPPDTLICPGHGPLTTVAEEKAHNPFF